MTTSENAPRRPLSILIVGDHEAPEFHEAALALRRWGTVRAVGDPTEELPRLEAEHDWVDLICVAQTYPGQWPRAVIERLARLAPIARTLVLLGPWCEGEARTGSPPPGWVRVYWHQWLALAERELAAMSTGRVAAWSFPHTATDADRILFEVPPRMPSLRGRVLVSGPDRAFREMLADACRRAGLDVLTPPVGSQADTRRLERDVASLRPIDLVLMDAAIDAPRQLAIWRHIRRLLPGCPAITIEGFPRVTDRQKLQQAGAACLLSKPLLLPDLWWVLERYLPSPLAGVRPGGAHHTE